MSDEFTPPAPPVLPPSPFDRSGLPDGYYFVAEDFRCHDGTPYPQEWLGKWLVLRDLCDAIRGLWGGPLFVVSGYRTPRYNENLIDGGSHGVVSGSYHTSGEAVDLRTKRGPVDVPHLLRVVLTAHEDGKLQALGGVGDYPVSGWLHVDTFKAHDGHLRRWHGR